MKRTLFIIFVILFAISLRISSSVDAAVLCNPDTQLCDWVHVDFINPNHGTTWEVRYKYEYTSGQSDKEYPAYGSATKSIMVNNGTSYAGLYTPIGWYNYKVHWATTCADPIAPVIKYQKTVDNIPQYFISVNLDPQTVSGGKGNGENLGTVGWTGPSSGNNQYTPRDQSKCTPCTKKSCSDLNYECGSYTTCSDTRSCGGGNNNGCYGTKVCSNHKCEQNYGCNNNGQCVERQCQAGDKNCYAGNTCQGKCQGPIGGKIIKPDGKAYTAGAVVVKKPNSAANWNPDNASNKDLSNANGDYNFPGLVTGDIFDIRLGHTGDGLGLAADNIINSCVYDTTWVKQNVQVANSSANFKLAFKKYNISGKLWWDPDGTPGTGDEEPYVNYNPAGTANDIPGKSVTVRLIGEGRNDVTDGTLGPNNAQAGRYSIGGNNTDGNGKNYTVQIETRDNPPAGVQSIRPNHKVENENSRPNADRKVVTVNCGNVTGVNFYISPDLTTYNVSGTVWVDKDNSGDYTPPPGGTDYKYAESVWPNSATVNVEGGKSGTVDEAGDFTVRGSLAGNRNVTLAQATLRDNYTVLNNPRVVNLPPAATVRFLLRRVAPTAFSINGGLFEDNGAGANSGNGIKDDDEDYIAVSTEKITIDRNKGAGPEVLNGTNFPGFIFNSNGLYIPDLATGTYTIAISSIRDAYKTTTAPSKTVTVGPGCTGCTVDRNAINVDFGIRVDLSSLAWIQGIGGDMRADNGLTKNNFIPTGSYFSQADNALGLINPGVVFGTNLDLSDAGGNSKDAANNNGWFVSSIKYASSTIKTSYGYIEGALKNSGLTTTALFKDVSSPCGATGPNCTLNTPLNTGVYTSTGDLTLQGSDNNFKANSKYVILVKGNLTIRRNITLPIGSTLLFIVSGNISVASNVTRIDGIYSADRDFTVPGVVAGNDQQLVINGSVIANASKSTYNFTNNRVLVDNANPSVKINYRPDFVLNAPNLIRYSNFVIQEVAPGN